MAGAPTIELADAKPGMSVADMRAQLEPELTDADRRLLGLLFLRHDAENLVALLKDPEAEVTADGLYSREEYGQILQEASEIDLGASKYPAFLVDFAHQYPDMQQQAGFFAEDEMLLRYYQYGISQSSDSMVRQWFQLNLDVTNIMTAMIARKQGWNASEYVRGEGEVVDMIRTNDSHDFGLGALLDYTAAIMPIVDEQDPVEKERRLDAFKWLWLDEKTFADTFSVEAVFAYLCKLEIQERWARLDAEQGRATFEQIINDLRSEAKVPEEFIRK